MKALSQWIGAALPRLLEAAGEPVVEVLAFVTGRERGHLHRAGKSDPGDALAIAWERSARQASVRSRYPG